MKYALVDSKATIHFQYLVAVEDGLDFPDVVSYMNTCEPDHLEECWDTEEFTGMRYVSDEEILEAAPDYMKGWTVASIKERVAAPVINGTWYREELDEEDQPVRPFDLV